MTGKSSSNKVPASTLYYFIASGFWSCKCSGIEEDLSAVSPVLSKRDLFFSRSSRFKSHLQAGRLKSRPIFKVGWKLRRSPSGNKSFRDRFPSFTSSINHSKTSSLRAAVHDWEPSENCRNGNTWTFFLVDYNGWNLFDWLPSPRPSSFLILPRGHQ